MKTLEEIKSAYQKKIRDDDVCTCEIPALWAVGILYSA